MKKIEKKEKSEKKPVVLKSRLRQNLMFGYYTDATNRETFDNATQSALKAGYSKSQAEHITMEAWFKQRLENFQDIESLAETIIRRNLERSDTKKILVNEEILEVIDPKIMKIQTDLATWGLERLASSRYKTKVELAIEEHNNLEQNDTISKLFYKTK